MQYGGALEGKAMSFLLFSFLALSLVRHAHSWNSTTEPSPYLTNHPVVSPNSTLHHDAEDHDSHDSQHWEHHGIHVASIKFDYVKQPLIVSIFMIVVVLCKLGFHHANFLSSWMPESCLLIVLGVVVGGVLHAAKVDTASFYYINPDSFFLFLLPPCILEAAYGLHDPVFFENIGTIVFYAIIGTLINCFIIGPVLYCLAISGAMGDIDLTFIECLVFSSLVVAVDPVAVLAIFQEVGVNSVLYFLVFGESLLNDAVTVVLYNTITTLSQMGGNIPPSEVGMAVASFFTVSLGGLAIGLLFGILSALITRLMMHVRVVEPLAILSLAYASYLMAELFHFSGIISMIGCGLIQMQYAFHNISNNSNITIKYFVKMLSGACDSIIFMFLGIALVRDDHDWHTGFILWSALLCLVVRFLGTYGLTFLVNRTHRTRSIGNREQFIMAYGGLRGAVAFCLVAMLTKDHTSHKLLFQTATFFIILFTVFVQGITIKPLVKVLRIEGEEEKIVCLYQEINNHVTDHLLVFMEEVIGHYGHNSFQGWLDKINDKYLKKILQRDPFTKDEIIMEVYQQIALQQHYESVYGVDMSSRIQLYQPEISAQEKKESVIPGSPEANRSIEDVVVRLMQAKNRRRLTSMVSTDWEEEQINFGDPYRVYDTVMSLPPYMAKNIQNAKQTLRSNSVGQEEEQKTPTSRWKLTRDKLKIQLSKNQFEPDQLVLTPNTHQLRKWMIKAPNKDAFSRRADRNLKEGDKSDLLKLLNDKQLRHNRYIRGQSIVPTSAFQTPVRSRAGSLDALEAPDDGHTRTRSNTQLPSQFQEQLFRKKPKTVEFDETHVPGKYTPRYQQKRPASSQPFYGHYGSGDSRSGIGEHSPLIHSPSALQEINEEQEKNGAEKAETEQPVEQQQQQQQQKQKHLREAQESLDARTRSPLKRQDAEGDKTPIQKLNEDDL